MISAKRLRLARLGGLILAFLTVEGCPPNWHVTIVEMKAAGVPQFCISKSANCTGGPVLLDSFAVQEVRRTGEGRAYRTVWAMHRTRTARVGVFTYGIAPDGWRTEKTAELLHAGRLYTAGPIWFRIVEASHRFHVETGSLGEGRWNE